MHCKYEEVLAADPKVVFLYLNLMAAEAEVEKDRASKAKRDSRKRH